MDTEKRKTLSDLLDETVRRENRLIRLSIKINAELEACQRKMRRILEEARKEN